jgi:hypothetical protein
MVGQSSSEERGNIADQGSVAPRARNVEKIGNEWQPTSGIWENDRSYQTSMASLTMEGKYRQYSLAIAGLTDGSHKPIRGTVVP